MNSKVKLKVIKQDVIQEFDFEHAENILKIDKYNDFEIAEPKKFKFIDNALIKLASPKVSRKANRKDSNTEGEQVPK